ncbi:MAG: lytic murein transglycosylase [Pelagibacterales bacterium]|nr:lytic murein transglycosylase [Pelagibacterales bacterium]
MKIIKFFLLIYILFIQSIVLADNNFNEWVLDFKMKAKNEGISSKTVNSIMDKAVFLPKVIQYDRYQPEFYEDTKTYISKRVNKKKIDKALSLYQEKNLIIKDVENKFLVEKELLLALMGIETNFGKYLGKMDIVSSLATLSFDKRRSEFFTKELLILLKLIDDETIDPTILYGSWAGAFGNFQFMPRTIKNYAIDYNENSIIELKDIDDSFASAANYINKIGWKTDQPCFYKVELKDNVPKKYLNTSAKKIHNKKKLFYFEKYIHNYNEIDLNKNILAAIVTPDKDIIPDAENLSPAYLIFSNYELILKWNRSLRFALAVCTLKNEIKNAL